MDRQEFKNLKRDEQKNWLVAYTKKFFAKENEGPVYKNLAEHGITRHDIKYLFQSLNNLYIQCGIEPHYRRKIGRTDEELKQHIKNIAMIDLQTNCWITNKIKSHQPGTNRKLIKYKNRTMRLHQLSYLLFNGQLVSGQCIRHKCDNDGCFNPEHLVQGTYAENNLDTVLRGRHRSQTKRDSYKSAGPRHNLTNPYDYDKLLAWVKSLSVISTKNEWLYPNIEKTGGYAQITINKHSYLLHRLMLANKLGLKYENIDTACHKFPEGLPYSSEAPARNDINPDHLYNGNSSQNIKDSMSYHKGVKISFAIKQEIYKEVDATDFSKKGASEEFDLKLAHQYKVSPYTISRVRADAVNGLKYRGTTAKPIIQLTKEGGFVKKFTSARDAAKKDLIGRISVK